MGLMCKTAAYSLQTWVGAFAELSLHCTIVRWKGAWIIAVSPARCWQQCIYNAQSGLGSVCMRNSFRRPCCKYARDTIHTLHNMPDLCGWLLRCSA